MSIQHTTEQLPESQVKITVTVPWSDWEASYNSGFQSVKSSLKVDGFREGKVPDKIVEQKAGSETILYEGAERAVKNTYPDIVESEKLAAIGKPNVEITKIAKGEDLVYTVITTIMPTIELKDWGDDVKKVNKKFGEEKVEASQDDVNEAVDRLLKSRAKLITVKREAKDGDSVQIDFDVFVDGVKIENGTGRDHPIVLGSNTFIPGFEEKVVGMKEGEKKEFDIPFPEEYHAKHLAGKTAKFEVFLKLVQEQELPELTDEFVANLGGEQKTVLEFKNHVREGLQREKENAQKENRRGEILDVLIDKTTGEIPQLLIDEEVRKMLSEFEMQLGSSGMNLDSYLERVGKTREDLSKDWQEQGKRRVLSALALEKIITDQKIEVTKDEVQEEMNKTLDYYKMMQKEKELDVERLYSYTKNVLEHEKALQWLEGK